MVPRRTLRQPVQFFKQQMFYPSWLTTSVTNEVILNLVASLNAVTQGSTFGQLYDQYCIKGISATLIPRGNVDGVGTPLSSPVFSCIDYDGNFPATIADLNQYQSARQTRGTSLHKRYIKPKVLQSAYQTALSTGYSPKSNVWIDCNDNQVPHYGIVFATEPTPSQVVSYDLKVIYYLAFKNVR